MKCSPAYFRYHFLSVNAPLLTLRQQPCVSTNRSLYLLLTEEIKAFNDFEHHHIACSTRWIPRSQRLCPLQLHLGNPKHLICPHLVQFCLCRSASRYSLRPYRGERTVIRLRETCGRLQGRLMHGTDSPLQRHTSWEVR